MRRKICLLLLIRICLGELRLQRKKKLELAFVAPPTGGATWRQIWAMPPGQMKSHSIVSSLLVDSSFVVFGSVLAHVM